MPTFEYKARDGHGKMTEGIIDAVSKHAALSRLQAADLIPISVTPIGGEPGASVRSKPSALKLPSQAAKKTRITLTDKAVFCRQLAISVSSGIPLRDSLDGIMGDMDNAAFKAVLGRVIQRLTDGLQFSQAALGEPKVFDRMFVALIKAAEESGSMASTLEYLAGSMEKSDRLARKVRSIMAYPMFIGVFFVVISSVMTLFVLPKFQDIFGSYGSALPPLTRVVLGVNGFILHNIVLIAALAVAIVSGLILYFRTARGRLALDTMLLKLPLFGPIIRKIAVSRFARNMGMMIQGGVSAATAMEIASELLGNRVMESTLRATHRRVLDGSDIASSLDPSVFPRLVIRMVAVGESSGRLPEVLEKVADVYEDQVEGSILMATSLFEPIAISFFGAFVLILVLSIYMPIFTMASHMR